MLTPLLPHLHRAFAKSENRVSLGIIVMLPGTSRERKYIASVQRADEKCTSKGKRSTRANNAKRAAKFPPPKRQRQLKGNGIAEKKRNLQQEVKKIAFLLSAFFPSLNLLPAKFKL